MSATLAIDESLPGLSYELNVAIRSENLSSRTSHTYQHWIAQYLAYFELSNPSRLTETNVKEFLYYLRRKLLLSRARLNQAKEALIFLYDKVLNKPLETQVIEAVA